MDIKINTILINDKKLTKSLFAQLPKLLYPFDNNDALVETIIGYVEYKGTHLLIHQGDNLYRSAYEKGSSLYCNKKDALRMKTATKQELETSDVNEEIFVTNKKGDYCCVELHIPHVAFGNSYVLTSDRSLPLYFDSEDIAHPDDNDMKYNRKIMSNLNQIFLKA